MAFLRKHGLFDSVHVNGQQPKRRRLFGLLRCRHPRTTTYVRTDHRPGPGWMSDSYQGVVCQECGWVISEKRIY